MVLVTTTTTVLSLWVGIKYSEWLQLTIVAPVHPSSVFWPYFGEVADPTVVDIYTQARPGILRALGSAEAGELNSKLPNVRIKSVQRVDSTLSQPQEQIGYSYSLTAEDFGLQGFPDLVTNVRGSCRTDYTWMKREKSATGSGIVWDYYYPWGNSSNTQRYIVANEQSPSYNLEFVVWLHPGNRLLLSIP